MKHLVLIGLLFCSTALACSNKPVDDTGILMRATLIGSSAGQLRFSKIRQGEINGIKYYEFTTPEGAKLYTYFDWPNGFFYDNDC